MHTADGTFIVVDETLDYSTTYYWRVRGVTGAAPPKGAAPGGPWVSSVFTTKAEPKEVAEPEVREKVVTKTEVQVVEVPGPAAPPAAIPAWMLLTIIGIGAVLVIALVVLIVRTRRV